MNPDSRFVRFAARGAFWLLPTVTALLLLPSLSQATFISALGVDWPVEVDPAPTFTPVTLAPVEVNVPGIGGRVTFELGNEVTPPPAELPHSYDMRVRVENYSSSSTVIHSIELSGFGNIATAGLDLQASSDAPSLVDFVAVNRLDADRVLIDFDLFFPILALSPGETSFDIYFRFNQPVVPVSTFHVTKVNGVDVEPELAVQRVPWSTFEPVGRWTSHRLSSSPINTGPWMWDRFTSPTADRIDKVRITTNYVHQTDVGANPVAAPNTDRFEVAIGEDAGGGFFNILHLETIPVNLGTTTFLGNFESNGVGSGVFHAFYEFEIPLNAGFEMVRDKEYVLFVQSITDGAYQPVMNWVDAEPGQSLDEISTQLTTSFTTQTRANDRAFEIEVPEPGFAAGLIGGLGVLAGLGRRRAVSEERA